MAELQWSGGGSSLHFFHQSYKGFKKKFFKVSCSVHDPALLDGFPLYWVEKPGLKKPRSLEDLTPPDREMCQLLSGLGAMFDTAKMIKLEFFAKALKSYIGIVLIYASSLSLLVHYCQLHVVWSQLLMLCCFYADMTLNAESKKKLADLLVQRRTVVAGLGTTTPTNPPPSTTSAPNTSEPAPVDNRQKGVVVVAADSEDEDTCTGLVFKRPRVGDVQVAAHSAFDGHAPSFRDNPPSVSSPRNLIVHEGRGRALLITFYGKCTAFFKSNNCPYGRISIPQGIVNYQVQYSLNITIKQ